MNNALIAFGEPTPLLWMIIFLLIAFALQFVLCIKAKRKAIKCIPLYLVGGGFFLGGAVSMGLFGKSSAGAISGNGIVGLLIAAIVAAAFLGMLIAWLIYWIAIAKKCRRQ